MNRLARLLHFLWPSKPKQKTPVNKIVQYKEQLYEFAKRLEKTNRR